MYNTTERNEAIGRAVVEAFGLTKWGEFWQTNRGPKRTASLGAMVFDLIKEACPARPGPVMLGQMFHVDGVLRETAHGILESNDTDGSKIDRVARAMGAPIEYVFRDHDDKSWFSFIRRGSLGYTTLIFDPVHGLKTGSYFEEMNARGWADFDLTRDEAEG